MQFLFPNVLWALLALAIPIIIHLFYFRRFKKVYFTNVRLLKEVKEETSNRSKIKNLLILLSRMLAMAALIFAFAQPFIPSGDEVKKGSKVVSVFVDNSFSMNALSEDVPLFVLAKDKAKQIINSYKKSDQFQVLSHDFEGRHQRLVNKEDALTLVDELDITPRVRDLENVIRKQQSAITDKAEHSIIYVVSDFQKSISNINMELDSLHDYNFISLQAVQEQNISIDSAWFTGPVQLFNQVSDLVIKVSNYSNENKENIRVQLNYDGQIKPLGTIQINAGQSKNDTVRMHINQYGWQTASLSISDYPIEFDNLYHITFNVPNDINVLSIQEDSPDPFIRAAYSGFSVFSFDNIRFRDLQYSTLRDYDFVILDELTRISSGMTVKLEQFLKSGGKLLIIPSSTAQIEDYNSLFASIGANNISQRSQQTKNVASINDDEFVFNEVFEKRNKNQKLPTVQMSYTFKNTSRSREESLMTFRDGNSFLSKYIVGDGLCYVLSSPLDEKQNNLVRNSEVFVPMMYKMAVSKNESTPLAYTIGQNEIVEVNNPTDGLDQLFKLQGAQEIIPKTTKLDNKTLLSTDEQITTPGEYNLTLGDDIIKKLAFNFDRKESDLSTLNKNDLEKEFGNRINIINSTKETDLSQVIQDNEMGISLWKWCILLCLLFLGIETLLLRFWKN